MSAAKSSIRLTLTRFEAKKLLAFVVEWCGPEWMSDTIHRAVRAADATDREQKRIDGMCLHHAVGHWECHAKKRHAGKHDYSRTIYDPMGYGLAVLKARR